MDERKVKDPAEGGEEKPDDGKQASEADGKTIPFDDVPADKWYASYVADMYIKGYISGKDEKRFDPDGSIKRCELVKILALCSKADISVYAEASTFTDVEKDSWYHGFVEWASAGKIVNGVGDSRFAPERTITREEAAVIICRFAKLTADTSGVEVKDIDSVGDYAVDAVKTVIASGIMGGYPDGSFLPKAALSRAEFCKILSETLNISNNAAA